MDPRTMNRRNLCKAFVALALAASSGPLQKLAAAEPIATPGFRPAARTHSEERPKFFTCILRRQSHGGCETVLKKRERIEALGAERIMSLRGDAANSMSKNMSSL